MGIEITNNRCFVLWTKDKRGKVRNDPTNFSNAAAVINEGERQKNKGQIEDYNYSVVMCPQIGGEFALSAYDRKVLTTPTQSPSIEL